MFFLIFPGGIGGKKIRPLVALVVAGVILYRALMSLKFPQLQVQLINFFPIHNFDFEFLSAALQSLVSPVVPADAVLEHRFLLYLSIPILIFFWLVFGTGLEANLGRLGLVAFYFVGCLLGLILLMTPGVSLNAAFWLGNAAALFCMGACYLIYLDVDVKVYYVFWSFLTGGYNGHLEIPSLFFLVPMHVLLMASQSMFWYSVPIPQIPTHDGLFTPIAWNLVVPMLGVGATLVWLKYARKPNMPRRSDPVPAY